MSSWCPAHIRHRASRRQGHRCFWCDVPLAKARLLLDNSATGDHLIPRSKGGQHRKNVVASCRACNLARKDQSLEVWLVRVKFRLEKAGIPQFYDVILSRLATYGISIAIPATPATAPDHSPRLLSAPEG